MLFAHFVSFLSAKMRVNLLGNLASLISIGDIRFFEKMNETDIKIVDSIVSSDKILSVKIVENKSTGKRSKK